MPRRLIDRGHRRTAPGAAGPASCSAARSPSPPSASPSSPCSRPRHAAERQRGAAEELPRHRHRDRRPPDARRRRHQPGRDEAPRRAGRERRRRAADRRNAAHRSGHRRSHSPADLAVRTDVTGRGVPRHRRLGTRHPGDRRPLQHRLEGTNGTLTGVAAVDRDFVHALFGSAPYVLGLRAAPDPDPAHPGVPLDRARPQGRAAQPRLPRRRLRDRRDRLPAGPRIRALEYRGDRSRHRLHPADDLRLPVRPVHGLRGVHARPASARPTTRPAPPTRPSSSASPAPASSSPAAP